MQQTMQINMKIRILSTVRQTVSYARGVPPRTLPHFLFFFSHSIYQLTLLHSKTSHPLPVGSTFWEQQSPVPDPRRVLARKECIVCWPMTISDLQAHLPMMSFSNDIKQLRIDKNSMLFMLPPRIRETKTSPLRQLTSHLTLKVWYSKDEFSLLYVFFDLKFWEFCGSSRQIGFLYFRYLSS